MRLLCDANIGSRLAKAFAAAGHDVVRSIHALSQGAADEDILALAVAEKRVLITCDSDFGELVFLKRQNPPPAVIYVQFEPADVKDIVPRVLPLLVNEDIVGHMVVIGEKADRMTAFPKKEVK